MVNIRNILNLYNYFDSIIITDDEGIIQYYANMRTDIFDLKRNDIIGSSILDIHPYLTEETSSIMRVLKDGKPIYDQVEYLTTKHGQEMTNLYSTLPIIDNGKIIGAIDLARCIEENERQNIVLAANNNEENIGLYNIDDIITKSESMKEVKSKIIKVANTDSPVLIYGETGTGKELVAQALHTYSYRNKSRFIAQNCAAIPHNMLESILFGSVKGSYTGAENRKGLFEVANGGTLFLDEVNSMDLNMQSKLLRAIENKNIIRIGGTEPIPVDVRIIATLNEPPLECIENNKLREDLFFRLTVVQIDVPPLRERVPDILYLTEYFISMYNQKMNKNVEGITDEVRNIFLNYNWPGNVRELKNVIEGAFNIIGSRYIKLKDLPPYLVESVQKYMIEFEIEEENVSLYEKVERYEKQLLIETLNSTTTFAEAADKLKISKQSLDYKLKKYNLK
ncbi:arginine utilization regulatory protein [Keratinibaculum paraultunense]|uniref:Arginine utilization regulatory protein n=1 Tax=Keratinibaculum paraultunense TaxID=1278232 RepID=A0A4R3L4B2_9FIRM|nr:sigma 54-interacting transcriptional regulator [Keratinibaculum paraultunense]QQY80140.1 sigma 54-interacting transcriptional regulator [Keratinibaculum paraultunense]TCS91539.1 arginine utilization regulatory protein [Keratinibaculum paraultunense]